MAADDRVVAAHEQSETLHIVTSIPDHAPRESDPHYHLFMQAKARLKRQGLWKCILDDHSCAGVPELHHSHLEFSQINASDFTKVNEALGLHLTDDDEFQAWAESPGNLEVLCLTGDAPVLMADGSHKPLAKVAIGDQVIGHDLHSHPVTMTSVADFAGEIVIINGHRMTANHPVLTPAGWRPAASLRSGDLAAFAGPAGSTRSAGKFRMLGLDVGGLRGVEAEIGRAVVGPVAVDVVDSLGTSERSTDHPLHDDPVLHHHAPAAGRPVDDSDAPLWGEVAQSASASPLGLFPLSGELGKPALVRAEPMKSALNTPHLRMDFFAAGLACDPGVTRSLGTPARKVTQRRARRIPLGKLGGHQVVLTARNALLDDLRAVASLERWWGPILHAEHRPFIGQVYDIGVSGCRSFIAGDLVVHNCSAHHRTALGVHVLPGPLWEPMRFRKAGLEPPARFYTEAQWKARQAAQAKGD